MFKMIFFTARCYASAVLGLCPCLSEAGVLLKRQNVGSHTNNTTRYPRDSSFLMPKISAKFDRGHPLRGRRMQVATANAIETSDFVHGSAM